MKKEKTISEFLNKEYKEFSFHIIENRSIPSLVDGLKPTQRKILYVSEKYIKNVFNTVETLAGRVVSDAAYHHGSTSAEGATVNLSQDFKNNLNYFEIDGQFGVLKSPIASAPRYIKVKLSTNFNMVMKDIELLEYKIEEGKSIEPIFYLPIIPMVLVNSNSGIAVGFASNILNRDVKQVTTNCISYLKFGKISISKPCIKTFNGTFEVDKNNHKKWFIKGVYNIDKLQSIKVTELPPSMTYEKFEEHLDDLIKKEEILNWINNSKSDINYLVKFHKDKFIKLNDVKINKLLMLTDQVTENFTTLDENGKLKIFETTEQIIEYFVNFRLTYYEKRKDYQIKKLEEEIKWNGNKSKFIMLVIEGIVIINKKSKADIVTQLEKNNIEKKDNEYDYLLRIQISSFTKENLDKLKEEISSKKNDLKMVKLSIPKNVYLAELEELYKQI